MCRCSGVQKRRSAGGNNRSMRLQRAGGQFCLSEIGWGCVNVERTSFPRVFSKLR